MIMNGEAMNDPQKNSPEEGKEMQGMRVNAGIAGRPWSFTASVAPGTSCCTPACAGKKQDVDQGGLRVK